MLEERRIRKSSKEVQVKVAGNRVGWRRVESASAGTSRKCPGQMESIVQGEVVWKIPECEVPVCSPGGDSR